MEQNLEETTPAAEADQTAAEKPVRRRASRRASAAAGAAGEVAVTVSETEAAATDAPAPEAATAAEEPAAAPKRTSRARKKAVAAEPAEATTDAAAADASAEAAPAEEAPAAAPKKRASRARKTAAAPAAETEAEAPAADASTDTSAADTAPTESAQAESAQADSAKNAAAKSDAAADEAAEGTSADTTEAPARRSRRRANSNGNGNAAADENAAAQKTDSKGRGRGAKQETADSDAAADSEKQDAKQDGKQENGRQENSSRSSRTRQRDRKRRGGDDVEPEIAEDDVLLPIAGILDVLDNYAFVRTSGYLPGVSDVYVALGQVKKHGLRRGDAIVGAIRQPREGESSGRQKYNAIVKIDSVNGKPVEEAEKRADVAEMTAVYPQDTISFAAGAGDLGRAIDEAAPMGLGQRALIALPAKVTASKVLAQLAAGVTASKPEAHLMLVLTNARPEDATQLQRTVSGEVVAASFDRFAEDQHTIAELAIDRARRLVELGHDVVVLLDSLNDLVQAFVQNQQGSRVNAETAQALAVAHVKRLLAAGRNVENGGSLTLIATARTKSGVAADKQLLRELTPAVNSYVKISGTRNAPEVDAEHSYTLGL